MLSMEGLANVLDVPQRCTRAPQQVKPLVMHTYNQQMNWVDIHVADQHCVYYVFLQETIKWWWKLFFWLIETSFINSYILHNSILCPRKPNHLAYCCTIVESYTSWYISTAPPRQQLSHPRKCQTPDQSDPERLNHQLHLLDKGSSLHDCVVCSNRPVKSYRTPYYCKTCSNTRSHPCFERYRMLRAGIGCRQLYMYMYIYP